MSPSHLVAFVDESVHEQPAESDRYVFAAAVCSSAEIPAARDTVRSLKLTTQRKVHWREEPRRRRARIIEVVASLPLEHLLVVRASSAGEKPERRRRKCMERLLGELAVRDVTTVVFEARGEADDRRDRDMVAYLRAQRRLTSELRVSHVPGLQDPMLWVPDAVCGAHNERRLGNGAYFDALSAQVRVEVVDLRA